MISRKSIVRHGTATRTTITSVGLVPGRGSIKITGDDGAGGETWTWTCISGDIEASSPTRHRNAEAAETIALRTLDSLAAGRLEEE